MNLFQNRREPFQGKARRGPKTGAYMEIREDFGVPQRSHETAQQVLKQVLDILTREGNK